MFREMRRKGQLLSCEESVAILEKSSSGVLAVLGDDGYPYTVPLSYLYKDNVIYFHCAKVGHKMDAIMKEPKVSFCVIDKDQIVPEEYTTYFRSVIVFGKAHVIKDETEKLQAIRVLAEKYSPGRNDVDMAIKREYDGLCMVRIDIEHITGKEAIELKKHLKKQ